MTDAEQKEIALRQKRCKELYINAAIAYNKRTKGRKLKITALNPAVMMKTKQGGRNG